MSNLKEWAKNNNLETVYEQYAADREAIAEECMAEGLPGYGSTYELRVAALQELYPELFA